MTTFVVKRPVFVRWGDVVVGDTVYAQGRRYGFGEVGEVLHQGGVTYLTFVCAEGDDETTISDRSLNHIEIEVES